ncbi:MAG TPA: AI-2E family transporter [Casimicrobiaceae bacterium]
MHRSDIHRWAFLLLVVAVSLAFASIVWPFFGAVFWGTVLAIMLGPVYRGLVPLLRQRRTLASFVTVILCLLAGIVPLTLLAIALVREGMILYDNIMSRQADLGAYLQSLVNSMPAWLLRLLDTLGLTDIAGVQDALSNTAIEASRTLAGHAFSVGQNAFDFVLNVVIVLYLLFFLLRDGPDVLAGIDRALPLRREHKTQLFAKFASVIRATVKGNLVIALVQGVLGGVALALLGVNGALLLGALMAVLSLLPVVGSALVWAPIAVYFLFTGAIVKGIALLVFGTVVIGVVDNVLRPLLVGKDTRMPDYLVLISTLGGIALFGFNGFVIGPVLAALFVATWQQFGATQAALDE